MKGNYGQKSSCTLCHPLILGNYVLAGLRVCLVLKQLPGVLQVFGCDIHRPGCDGQTRLAQFAAAGLWQTFGIEVRSRRNRVGKARRRRCWMVQKCLACLCLNHSRTACGILKKTFNATLETT